MGAVMEQSLTLHYLGKKLRTGIEAEDLADAIVGFAYISRVAGMAVYGEEQKFDLTVRAVKPGSITINFLLEAAAFSQTVASLSLSSGLSATDYFGLLKSWFDLLRHLGGKPPTQVQKITNSPNAIQIQNSDGATIITSPIIYNIFNNFDIGKHAGLVAKPLRGRADGFEISVGKKKAANFNKREATALKSVQRTENQLEQESIVLLKVVAPVFEGGGMWRFSRGKNVITASIQDPKFLAEVQSGRESFSAGDVLQVRLVSLQQRVGKTIKETHAIAEVIEHERTT
ncbi:MAG: hypothetical protein C6Y20_20210 [Tagaea sp. CACIAM 22H2]|nr:hypothetical protein [Tagaea sp. CACIAM 22H2]